MYNLKKIFKKTFLIAGSSMLLMSNIDPNMSMVVKATSVDEINEVNIGEESVEPDSNKNPIEENDVITPNSNSNLTSDSEDILINEQSEEIIEEKPDSKDSASEAIQGNTVTEEEAKEIFIEGEEDSENDMEASFKEFLSSYNELSEEEILTNIDAFQLYIDDEKTIHSIIEVLTPEEFGANNNQNLVEKLQKIRFENATSQEDVATDSIEDLLADYSLNSVTTSSSIRQTTVERIAGQNRERVAENISKEGWTTSNTVIIANGYKFTDALAGIPLAAHYNAPMLLVNNTKIATETLNEISRLNAKDIIILGGTASVSEDISTTLKNRGLSVRRIAGQNRYDTSAKIASELISLRGPSTAHLVNGEASADAVSISTVAGRYKQPILLTKVDELHPEVQKIANTVKDWRIIGGTSSISSEVEKQLLSKVSNATRISGQNRYEVNKNVLNNWGIDDSKVFIGSGNSFADILAGSVYAAKENTGILLLSENDTDIANAKNYAKNKGLDYFVVLGGTSTLSNKITDTLKQLYVPDKKVVYIDPGHGGTDSGAVYSGLAEKSLNLSIALYLKNELDATGKYEVILSRSTDKTVSLDARTQDANSKNADIFVSLHHNSMGGTSAGTARGIETFIYHRVASGFGQETNRNNFNTDIPRIKDSLRLADSVHPRVISVSGLNDRGVKGNNFHVVRESNMPAILVEYGFMDNPVEFSIIKRLQYQQAVAKATKDGIQAYFGY